MTALVFDDDDLCRTLLKEVLNENQFDVTTFSDPIDFLKNHGRSCCESKVSCFDVILTDNQMPGMTGLEFLEMVKAKGCRLPASRKGIISGTWTNDQLSRASELGCRVFTKPDAIHAIEEWLENL